MGQDTTLIERYGVRDIPSDHPGFRVVFSLAPGQDSVIVHLDGGAWPSGLVLTAEGRAVGGCDAIPDLDTFTALGWQDTINVQGLEEFAVRVSTAGAAGHVRIIARGHRD